MQKNIGRCSSWGRYCPKRTIVDDISSKYAWHGHILIDFSCLPWCVEKTWSTVMLWFLILRIWCDPNRWQIRVWSFCFIHPTYLWRMDEFVKGIVSFPYNCEGERRHGSDLSSSLDRLILRATGFFAQFMVPSSRSCASFLLRPPWQTVSLSFLKGLRLRGSISLIWTSDTEGTGNNDRTNSASEAENLGRTNPNAGPVAPATYWDSNSDSDDYGK